MQFTKTKSFQFLVYFTKDKPKANRGAVIENRCKQREEKKSKERKSDKGREALAKSSSNKQQITSRVTHFVFPKKLHGPGERRERNTGTWRGSGGDGVDKPHAFSARLL